MTLRVAFCGDSAMWGQGLTREHTYAHLATTRIAEQLGDTIEVVEGRNNFEPLRGESRSGAKIRPKQDVDAETFIDTFPLFVPSEQQRLDLTFGRDESPGAALFGEHPATFPTVSDVMRHFAAMGAADVDLVLVDGGINDIDFEEVLDPQGPQLTTVAARLKAIFGDSLKDLLRQTRRAFPNAIVIVVGYFSALSEESDKDELETLFKFLADKPEWQVAVNDVIQEIPIVREILNDVGITKDIDGLILKAIRRSTVAAAHAHFWTRRTILELPGSVVEPGIIYAHPAFRARHALFAGRDSLLNEGYRLPGDGRHEVHDEMLVTRTLDRHLPRVGLLDQYRALNGALVGSIAGLGDLDIAAELARTFDGEDDLPTKLRVAAERFAADPDLDRASDLLEHVQREIGRIEVTSIASFIHPNPRGAQRYADRIVESYNDYRHFSVRDAVRSMRTQGEAGLQLGAALERHGLVPRDGIRRLRHVAMIESVAFLFEGLGDQMRPVTVSLGGVQLDCDVRGSRSKKQFFAFDAALTLGEVAEVTLLPLPVPLINPSGSLPVFTRLTVLFNGAEFRAFDAANGDATDGRLVLWSGG